MKLIFFLFTASNAYDYTFDHNNGLLFQENDPVWVYDARVPVDVNVMLMSPREKFRTAFKAGCGEDYLEDKLDANLFGRNDTNTTSFKESAEDCVTAFKTFDNAILSFLGEDLVTTWRYNITNEKKRFRLEKEEFDRVDKEMEIAAGIRRSRRSIDPVTGLLIAGTLGYAISVDARSMNRDKLLTEEIELERRRISVLEDVVETVNDKLDEAVKRIRKSRRPIVSWGGLSIPDDAKAVKMIMEGADAEINQYFAHQSASMGKEITQAVLTLQNHRLPLNPVFLDAIKAQCIAHQQTTEEEAKLFCNNYAFHSTRWDTRLRFTGMGITTWERKDGKTLGKDDMEIRQVIISIRIEIPRMKMKARKLTAVNLGYFKKDQSRWRVEVPQHLVVMPSKEVLEMRPGDCDVFTPTYACAAVSLAPNQCAESILLHNSTKFCETREIDNRKCGYFEDTERAFVSMREPGIAQFFHHAPSENVNQIDSVKKTKFPGVLNCGPAILRISASMKPEEKTTMIKYIDPMQIKMRSIQEEEIASLNSKILQNLDTVKSMGNTIVEMNMTTLELMKTTAIIESKNAAEEAKDYIFKTFITPLIGTLGTLIGLVIIAVLLYALVCRRKKKRKTMILGGLSRTNRSECSM
jgi:hypothetical protein